MSTGHIEFRMKRDRYHHGSLPAEAVAAALDLVRAKGGPDFSLREVAAALGVSHGALYRHFEDRDALLAAVATRGFGSLFAAQQASVQTSPASDRVLSLCRIHFGFAMQNPAEYRVMFHGFLNNADRDNEAVQAAAYPTRQTLIDAVATWREEAGFGMPVPQAAATVWSAVHGLIMLTLDGFVAKLVEDEQQNSGILDVVCGSVLGGIASAPSQ